MPYVRGQLVWTSFGLLHVWRDLCKSEYLVILHTTVLTSSCVWWTCEDSFRLSRIRRSHTTKASPTSSSTASLTQKYPLEDPPIPFRRLQRETQIPPLPHQSLIRPASCIRSELSFSRSFLKSSLRMPGYWKHFFCFIFS